MSRAAVTLIALSVARGAIASPPGDDITVPPPFLPPITLSADSRLVATADDGRVVLTGHVASPLEHFLARHAITARHVGATGIVDRVIVLPARVAGERAYAAEARETPDEPPGPTTAVPSAH